MARGRDTEVQVYEGEVESLSSAAVRRASASGSSPTAARASPTPAPRRRRARRDPRRGPRQRRVRHARRVRSAWPSPTAWRSPTSTSADELARAFPTDRKVDAGPRARAGRAGRRPAHLAASSRPSTATRWPRAPSVTTTGIRTAGRETGLLRRRPTPWPPRATRPRPGFGFSVGREPGRARPRQGRRRRRRAGHPPARRGQAGQPSGSPWCSTRGSPRSSSASSAGTLNGEAVLKGRSLFADRLGEEVAVAARHPGRRPHRTRRLHRHRDRRRGPGHPAQRR